MIEIDEEKEIVVIESDVRYLHDTIKPSALSFRGSAATEINMSLIDSSELKDMSYMFAEMKNIESLDLSDFDTSSATTMTAMFYNSTFESLDLSSFDTSNVTNMNALFQACRSLISVNLSSFDTSYVTNMPYLFTFCVKLQSLDLSNFDTSNVTNMANMFAEMSQLKEIVGIIDMQNVTNANNMLSYCQKLQEVRLKNLKTNLLLNTALSLSESSIDYVLMNVQTIIEPKTITLGSNMSKASEEAIANAVQKGWILN